MDMLNQVQASRQVADQMANELTKDREKNQPVIEPTHVTTHESKEPIPVPEVNKTHKYQQSSERSLELFVEDNELKVRVMDNEGNVIRFIPPESIQRVLEENVVPNAGNFVDFTV